MGVWPGIPGTHVSGPWFPRRWVSRGFGSHTLLWSLYHIHYYSFHVIRNWNSCPRSQNTSLLTPVTQILLPCVRDPSWPELEKPLIGGQLEGLTEDEHGLALFLELFLSGQGRDYCSHEAGNHYCKLLTCQALHAAPDKDYWV